VSSLYMCLRLAAAHWTQRNCEALVTGCSARLNSAPRKADHHTDRLTPVACMLSRGVCVCVCVAGFGGLLPVGRQPPPHAILSLPE
jgi:hypothetical protein